MRTFALNPRKRNPPPRRRCAFALASEGEGHVAVIRAYGVFQARKISDCLFRIVIGNSLRKSALLALMPAAPFRAGAGAAALRTKGTPRRPNKTPPRLRRVLPYDGARGCVLNAVCGAALRRGTYIRPCGCRCGWCRLRSRTSGPAGSSPFPRWRALSRWWRCCRRPRARRS